MTPKALSRGQPPIFQMFDRYVDREYFKVTPGFFGTSSTKIRTDRLENETTLNIKCHQLPEKVYVNGELYQLTKINI
jgi:hypothetical protein